MILAAKVLLSVKRKVKYGVFMMDYREFVDQVVKDIKEVLRPAFKVVSVFDVSQTDGRELPSLGVNELTGDVD